MAAGIEEEAAAARKRKRVEPFGAAAILARPAEVPGTYPRQPWWRASRPRSRQPEKETTPPRSPGRWRSSVSDGG